MDDEIIAILLLGLVIAVVLAGFLRYFTFSMGEL